MLGIFQVQVLTKALCKEYEPFYYSASLLPLSLCFLKVSLSSRRYIMLFVNGESMFSKSHIDF